MFSALLKRGSPASGGGGVWPFRRSAASKKPERSRGSRGRIKQIRGAIVEDAPGLGFKGVQGGLSGEALVRANLVRQRALSRELAETVGGVHKFLELLQRHVVGPHGFSFESQAKNALGRLDKDFNSQIEAEWKSWSRVGQCDVTGELSLRDVLNQAVTASARDGDVLIRIVDDYENDFGFALELIEGDQLDVSLNEDRGGPTRISMGVEVNRWGKPVRYHVLRSHPGQTLGADRERVVYDARDIIHLKRCERVRSIRSLPWWRSVFLSLFQYNDFVKSELRGARWAARKLGVFEIDPDAEPYREEDEDTGEVSTEDPGALDEVIGEDGEILVAPHGYKFKAVEFNHPGKGGVEFADSIQRDASAGFGVSTATQTGDYSKVNFSGQRQAVAEERDKWTELQEWLIEHVLDRVYTRWLEVQILSGRIAAKYSKHHLIHKFRGRRWGYVDPLKDEKANSEALLNGTRSPQEIIRASGRDPEDVKAEIRSWNDEMGDIMRMLWSLVSSKSVVKEEKDEDDDENGN